MPTRIEEEKEEEPDITVMPTRIEEEKEEEPDLTVMPTRIEEEKEEEPDLTVMPTRIEEEKETGSKGVKLFKVSGKTEAFLKNAFTTIVPNQTQRQWHDNFRAPNTAAIAGLSMDKIIKSKLSALTK